MANSPRADHRIREQVVRTGDVDLFPELGIPRKTALSWIRRGAREVVTLEDEAWAPSHHVRIAELERRVAMLSALLRLVLTLLRVSGFELDRARVPDSADKRRLLNAVERARYVTQHNRTMPHNAFQGQTPDLPDELAARRRAARQQRVARSRSASCSACPRAAPPRNDEVAA